jgi:hypothetical protein
MRNSRTRKEVTAMKYEKPEVVLLNSATKAVQEMIKGQDSVDSEPSDPTYQSDE